ncbi:MAG: radical SAM protein [Candidatus Aminicenantes bacterium]|nr:radical SAM protein [Candidatus Aminicenantes bacterium]
MENISNEKKPFIKKFKTKNRYYIYDVNTNEILGVNKTVYDIIDEIYENNIVGIVEKFKHNYPVQEIKENYDLIKRMEKEKRYFFPRSPNISSGINSIEDVKSALRSGLPQIVMELTDRCNQRCCYCSFSGEYAYTRTHGKNDMTFQTAKKALDFFIKRAGEIYDNQGTAVTYYGGEPLLRFDLLKETVDYVVNIHPDKKVRFAITTNGTLLYRKDVIDFLVKNDIGISISIDGPVKIHNRYRLFVNKKPTFNRIFKNLAFIKEKHPDYFSRKISIIAVLAPPFEIEEVSVFFYKNDFFNNLKERITIGLVDPVDTTFFKDYHLEDEIKKVKNIFNRLVQQYKEALIKDTYNELTIEKDLFLRRFYNIASRKIYPLGKVFPPKGGCFPGRRKLFVDTCGKFFMCEKVSGNFEIGNVEKGFYYEKIYRFCQEYDRFFSDCKYCWALRLCDKCFNSIRKGEKMDFKRKKEFCITMRDTIEGDLITYCEIIEKNPTAFKVYENMVIR